MFMKVIIAIQVKQVAPPERNIILT